ncbi:MAG: oligosaccharide flippase family protein [Actinobacteria bacterium]|nr:oligosaccharide flippase family protein [Actinomycetota bacterium]
MATLVATPVLFDQLGASQFGIWIILLGSIAIVTYADGGIGSMLLRETSQAHTTAASLRRAQGALALGILVPTALGALLLCTVWLSWPTIAPIFGLRGLAEAVRDAALLLAAAVIVDGWGAARRAALEGTGHMPRAAAVTAATAILATLLGVVAVLSGLGLVGLALATLAGAVVRCATFILLARRAAPQLRPRLCALRRADVRPLMRYGSAVQLSQAGGAVNAESDRLVVAGVAGAAAAGALELALRLANLVALVPFCLLYALFPALARLAGDGDRTALDAAYVRGSRHVAAACLVPAALLAACASSVVVLWLGRPVPFAAAALAFLGPAVAVRALTGVASAMCRAEGIPWRETRFSLLTALLNIVLTIVLAVAVGPIGVPIATAAATVVGATCFLIGFHRATARPMSLLWDALRAPAAAALAAGTAAAASGLLLPDGGDRAHAAIAVAVMGLAGTVAALFVLALMRHARASRPPRVCAGGQSSWVVYLSAIPFDGTRNRQQELAEQVAETRRVLFVEAPGLGMCWRLNIEALGPSLWRARPLSLLPLGRFVPHANRLNRRYSGWRLRRWLDRRPGERIVIIDEDLAAPLASRLGARTRVYDASDLDWTFTRRWNRRHLRGALSEAVGDADAVLVSSPVLADHMPRSRGPVIELLNACEAQHFAGQGDPPSWMRALPGPRIGYVGSLDRRAFHADLMAQVAGAHPEWTFILAGPADEAVVAELRALSNVHLPGAIAYAALPGLLGGFDVCLIPYRVGELIDYVQPKKLFEYLAAGKPVVATAMPALALLDVPHRRAATAESFALAIAGALREDLAPADAEARRRSVSHHSWQARGRTIRRLLDDLEATA